MSTLRDFILASASYFGIPAEQIMEGSTIDASQGDFDVVLRVSLTPDDLKGVAGRMATMLLERKVDEAVAFSAPAEVDRAKMREAYNALPKAERSAYGSFAKYVATNGGVDPFALAKAGLVPGGPENTTPEPKVLDLPPYAWVPGVELTEQQKMLAVGQDQRGRYAMQPDDLTDEQRKEYKA